MNAVVSIVLLAAVLGVIVFLLSRRENGRRSQYGPAGLSEFRTDPVHPAAGPRPPDRGHPDLHPGGLWLQGAAVPAGDAGRIHGPEAGRPPDKISFAPKVFSFAHKFAIMLRGTALCGAAVRASSSVGQSWRLITAWSRVQVLAGPPKKHEGFGLRASFLYADCLLAIGAKTIFRQASCPPDRSSGGSRDWYSKRWN